MTQVTQGQAGDEAAGPGVADQPVEAYLSRWTAQGEHQRWPLPADGRRWTVGRSSATDVHLSWDPEVSRVHAELERMGGRWTLADDGLSRNGTFVNGVRVSGRVRLRDGDRVRFGATVLTFCSPAQTATQHTLAGGAAGPGGRLTQPQRAVLVALCRPHHDGRLYAAPASNQEIAAELYLTVDAVKTHLRTLFAKFGIESLPQNQKRARLAEMALELGLVSERDLRSGDDPRPDTTAPPPPRRP